MTDLPLDAPLAGPRRDRAALAGWGLSALFALFMLGASALPKLAGMPVAQEAMAALGWADAPVFWIGVAELAFTLLVLRPRTALLGAILTMGLLGGAVATQLRAGSPLLTHTLFSVCLGAVMWGGLVLREPRLRPPARALRRGPLSRAAPPP
jgi:hypothetical protein